jgi:hypothetical protein
MGELRRGEPMNAEYVVYYNDVLFGDTRARTLRSLKEALEFIEMRAIRPHLYNDFKLVVNEYEIKPESKYDEHWVMPEGYELKPNPNAK